MHRKRKGYRHKPCEAGALSSMVLPDGGKGFRSQPRPRQSFSTAVIAAHAPLVYLGQRHWSGQRAASGAPVVW